MTQSYDENSNPIRNNNEGGASEQLPSSLGNINSKEGIAKEKNNETETEGPNTTTCIVIPHEQVEKDETRALLTSSSSQNNNNDSSSSSSKLHLEVEGLRARMLHFEAVEAENVKLRHDMENVLAKLSLVDSLVVSSGDNAHKYNNGVERPIPENYDLKDPGIRSINEDSYPNDDHYDTTNNEMRYTSSIRDNLRSSGLQKFNTKMIDHLPNDTFSFLIMSNPCSVPFATACVVYFFQIFTYILVALSLVDMEEAATHDNMFNIPANVERIVRVSQMIAIVISVIIQDDIRTGLNLFQIGYDRQSLKEGFPEARSWNWILSVILRVTEGGLGLFVTFMLVVTEHEVIELLLNFTAMQFVSQLDEICFFMSHEGFLGKRNTLAAGRIRDTEYCTGNRGRSSLRTILLGIFLVSLLCGWLIIARNQATGKYLCSTVYVQFDDDFVAQLGSFSGLYDRRGDIMSLFSNRRVTYVARNDDRAVFGYCADLESWTLSINTDRNEDNIDPCNWIAVSERTSTFDLTETSYSNWFVRNSQRETTLEHLFLSCYDCGKNVQNVCGGRGFCENAICSCDEGWYGLRCEFPEPCLALEIDSRFDGFGGNHEWATTFYRLQLDDNSNEYLDVYHRPLYINEYSPGQFDIIVFTGRRWAATFSGVLTIKLDENGQTTSRALATYFNSSFHPYWSNFRSLLISDPLDVGTPKDSATPIGIPWFELNSQLSMPSLASLKTKEFAPESAEEVRASFTQASDSIFLCAVCNEESNPCRFDGQCVNGKCICSMGASGTLCQIPPVGNGHCDSFYNTLEYEYDGGDCCESTCVSAEFTCGKDELGFEYVGYDFCHLPAIGWRLNGHEMSGSEGSLTGYSIALSNNGEILAVSDFGSKTVRVFDKDGSQWIQRGTSIETPSDLFVGSITMSSGAMNMVKNAFTASSVTLVIGTSLSTTGIAFVYECSTYRCEMVAQFAPFASDYQLITVVDVSDDGNTIAIGGSLYPETNVVLTNKQVNSTLLAIFKKNEVSGVFESHNLNHLFSEDEPQSVYSVSLSGNGDTIAVGSYIPGFNVMRGGPIIAVDTKRVYKYDGTFWNQLGKSIIDRDAYSFLRLNFQGRSVALSDDGRTLAVGLTPDARRQQHVRIFRWDYEFTFDWVQRGSTIRCDSSDADIDFVVQGWSIALSKDGTVIAIGSAEPSIELSFFPSIGVTGAVCTFRWDVEDWGQLGSAVASGYAPSVSISSDGFILGIGLPLFEPSEERRQGKGRTFVYEYSQDRCPSDSSLFRLSLTTDDRPDATSFTVISNNTKEVILEGGPYPINLYVASYVYETCVPTDDCTIFTIYDDLDLKTTPVKDGMRSPGSHSLFLDGEVVGHGRLEHALERIFIGSSCLECPTGTQLFQMFIQTCADISWQLDTEGASFYGLKGGGARIFADNNYGDYLSEGSYKNDYDCSFEHQKTYWEDVCLPVDSCSTFQIFGPPQTSGGGTAIIQGGKVDDKGFPAFIVFNRLFMDKVQISENFFSIIQPGSNEEKPVLSVPIGDC